MGQLDVVKVSVLFGVDKPATSSYARSFSTSPRDKVYNYRALKSLGIHEGDLVVVKTPSHGFTVVRVSEEPTDLISLNHMSYC